jgi:hypothetical protein
MLENAFYIVKPTPEAWIWSGANPTILSYNASAVKKHQNETSAFWKQKYFLLV